MMNTRRVIAQGIFTGAIRPGDDVKNIVIQKAVEQVGEFQNGDILGITEAVVAYSQKNFCSFQNVGDDVENKFDSASEIVLIDPIHSRNRFMPILKGILKAPSLKKIYIIMTYPSDEVGNAFFDKEIPDDVNPNWDAFTVEEFYAKFGIPCHMFTGLNYIEEYLKICSESGVEGRIILCNNLKRVPELTNCTNFLVCNIHSRDRICNTLKKLGEYKVFNLENIMNSSIDGSGYNDRFGLYGSNQMNGEELKLMPVNCQEFVYDIQNKILSKYGVRVEVLIFGDGAFKDPNGKIWEFADPDGAPGYTSGLSGTPKEVKAKLLISGNKNLSAEEISAIINEERNKRLESNDITSENSLGTTPRQITALVSSLCDLITGSGDRMTPAVLIRNYF